MKAVIYGAGSIGRGFIGALFSEIGYEVVFVDVNDSVIDRINTEKTYPQIIMNAKKDIHWIKNIRAVDGKDPHAVAFEITDADILATSVGASILPKIAPVIAQGLIKRWEKDSGAVIDLLICENLMDADILLRQYLLDALPSEYHTLMDQNLGLVETSIGRMVPPADPDSVSEYEHPLAVRAEPYDFLPVDKAAFKGKIPNYQKIIPFEPFHYYLERKLYIHNMAHLTTALLGQREGISYIHEAALNPGIQRIVQGAMTESALMLTRRYSVDYADLQAHMDDLLYRFQNPYLKDTAARVAREPLRKLQPSDRLVGAARSCENSGITPVYLSFAIALCLSFMKDEDPEEILEKTCKIRKTEQLFEHILYFYDKVTNNQLSLNDFVLELTKYQAELRGMIV